MATRCGEFYEHVSQDVFFVYNDARKMGMEIEVPSHIRISGVLLETSGSCRTDHTPHTRRPSRSMAVDELPER